MLRATQHYIKKYGWLYAVAFVFLFLEDILALIPVQMTQTIVDAMNHNQLQLQAFKSQMFLLLLVAFGSYLLHITWVYIIFGRSSKYSYSLRTKIFQKLINMRIAYYEKFHSGDMMTRFTSDINNVSEFMGYGLMCLCYAVSTLAYFIPIMLLTSWQITVFALLPIIGCGYLIHRLGHTQEVIIEAYRDSFAQLSSEVLEVVEGIRVTRAYGKREQLAGHFFEQTKKLRTKNNRIAVFSALYGRLSQLAIALSLTIVLGLGAYYMLRHQVTIGQVIALQVYTMMLLDSMWVITDFILVYQSAKVSYDKIEQLMKTSDDQAENGIIAVDHIHSISFKNYYFHYQNSSELSLDNITVDIQAGKTLGIVGKTGSGKTTLVRQLLQQYPYGSGEYHVNGYSILDVDRTSLEKHIAYVPQ